MRFVTAKADRHKHRESLPLPNVTDIQNSFTLTHGVLSSSRIKQQILFYWSLDYHGYTSAGHLVFSHICPLCVTIQHQVAPIPYLSSVCRSTSLNVVASINLCKCFFSERRKCMPSGVATSASHVSGTHGCTVSQIEQLAKEQFEDDPSTVAINSFYPRDAMLARVFATATCLSVRLSVRLSHAGIVPSRAKA